MKSKTNSKRRTGLDAEANAEIKKEIHEKTDSERRTGIHAEAKTELRAGLAAEANPEIESERSERKEKKQARQQKKKICCYLSGSSFSPLQFGRNLRQLIEERKRCEKKKEVLFLCIGSDRATGDSLGPLIGYKLERIAGFRHRIVGTLEQPVHAINLADTMQEIRFLYPEHLVIAIDASIGRQEQVGWISVGCGSLRPGQGVCKDLEQVGDIFITGVVGSNTCREVRYLQSVRLASVMHLADCICEGICCAEESRFDLPTKE